MKYKSNFIKSSIFRLDFNEVPELRTNINDDFLGVLAEDYLIPEKKSSKTIQFSIASDGSKTIKEEESWRWEFQQRLNKNNIVVILKDAFVFECRNNQYIDFPSFKKNIESVFEKFISFYKLQEFRRIGLRYTNEIHVPGRDPLNWDGIVSSGLCQAIKTGQLVDSKFIRSMHQLAIKKDDINILFNYGIFNRDYPNPVAKPEFMLDYDCYIVDLLNERDIFNKLSSFNTLVSEMFESHIADDLRKIMGGFDESR